MAGVARHADRHMRMLDQWMGVVDVAGHRMRESQGAMMAEVEGCHRLEDVDFYNRKYSK